MLHQIRLHRMPYRCIRRNGTTGCRAASAPQRVAAPAVRVGLPLINRWHSTGWNTAGYQFRPRGAAARRHADRRARHARRDHGHLRARSPRRAAGSAREARTAIERLTLLHLLLQERSRARDADDHAIGVSAGQESGQGRGRTADLPIFSRPVARSGSTRLTHRCCSVRWVKHRRRVRTNVN